MKKLIFGGIVVLAVVVFIGLNSINTSSGNPTSKAVVQGSTDTLKLGVIAPVTGDVASIGQAAQAAIKLSVDEVNRAGGVNGKPIEAIFEDGKCAASAAANAAQKFINVDKVNVILGGACSGETASFVKAAMTQKVPVFSYCSSAPTLTGSGPYFFRNYPSDSYAAIFAADYLYNTLGVKNVAVIYHVSDYGNALSARFDTEYKKLGGKISLMEGVSQGVKDYRTVISKIKNSGADYVYALMYSEGGAVFVNQSKQLGLNKKMLFSETAEDPKFVADVSGKADIQYYVAKSPSNAEFAAKMKTVAKVDTVPACSPQAYDAVKVIASVYSKTGNNPDAFATEMKKVSYDGVAGKTAFDENGDQAVAEFTVKKIENGKAVVIK